MKTSREALVKNIQFFTAGDEGIRYAILRKVKIFF